MPISTFRLRKATDADIGFLTHVLLISNQERYGKHPGWDADDFCRAMTDDTSAQIAGNVPDSMTYVITHDDADVGRLRLVTTTAVIEIAGLQVLPKHQNRGLGTAVINFVLERAARSGIPVELEVESDNPDARRLYERLGFSGVGEPAGGRQKMVCRTDSGATRNRV
ncbi:GNAT family N-acetyltransferase [Microlunatus endophyticus]|nr:GNAT family N-acetyltransferase [Microlunatus endophyticus]